jgi:hypothetical protein
MSDIKRGTPIIATYGFNKVLNQPFEFLYEFGYYTQSGKCVVYVQGERNMQDSYAFNLEQIRVATEEDLKNEYWGD